MAGRLGALRAICRAWLWKSENMNVQIMYAMRTPAANDARTALTKTMVTKTHLLK